MTTELTTCRWCNEPIERCPVAMCGIGWRHANRAPGFDHYCGDAAAKPRRMAEPKAEAQ